MLFFGFHMIFARTPEKEIFSNYLLSRRLMGIALLILSANYSVHLIYGIRLKDVNATILMNLSTYFICYWLFSSAMTTLLDNRYIMRKRFSHHVSMWIIFSATAMAVVFFIDNATVQSLVSGILALWLVAYGLTLSFRLLKTYRKAVRMFEETHSDDIESYIRGFPSSLTGHWDMASVAPCLRSFPTNISSCGCCRPYLSIYTFTAAIRTISCSMKRWKMPSTKTSQWQKPTLRRSQRSMMRRIFPITIRK